MKAPHLPFSYKFNDNETLASYDRGIYDYYDVERIEEFVAFKVLMMMLIDLKILLYLNIAMRIMNIMPILMHLLRKSPLCKKRLIFGRSLWKKELMKL